MSRFASRDADERGKASQTAEASLPVAKADLHWAAGRGVIAPGQVEPLWPALASRMPAPAAAPALAPSVGGAGRQRFDLVHVACSFGALLVISAVGWFMTLGWESFGGGGIVLIPTACGGTV